MQEKSLESTEIFKIFRGSIPPHPLASRAFGARYFALKSLCFRTPFNETQLCGPDGPCHLFAILDLTVYLYSIIIEGIYINTSYCNGYRRTNVNSYRNGWMVTLSSIYEKISTSIIKLTMYLQV